MKNLLKFLLFLLYTIIIFTSKTWYLLVVEAAINIYVMIIIKINFKKAMKNLLGIVIITAIMFIANAVLVDVKYSIQISVKLMIVCNITYSFSKVLTVMEFAKIIEQVCIPLKFFKINPKDVGIIISIAVTFIPILKNEFIQLKNVVKVKGYKLKISNYGIILKPFIISVFERVNDVTNVLKLKAYSE